MLMVKEVTILPLERPIAHLAKLRAPKTKPNLAACMKRGETSGKRPTGERWRCRLQNLRRQSESYFGFRPNDIQWSKSSKYRGGRGVT